MNLVIINAYLFFMAIVLALLEIQTEGECGWAKNLPTWRPASETWYSKMYGKIMSGKALTGYHLTLFSFVLMIFHLPFIFGYALTLENELKNISLFFLFIVVWDFLWFVLNPYYQISKFKAEHVWWHRKWLGVVPIDYVGGATISLLVLIPSMLSVSIMQVIQWWLINLFLFLVWTLATILLALFRFSIKH